MSDDNVIMLVLRTISKRHVSKTERNSLPRDRDMATNIDHAPKRKTRAASDAEIGICWWNAMSKQARLAALKAVEPEGRASPAEAWEHWKETAMGFKCEEENAHG